MDWFQSHGRHEFIEILLVYLGDSISVNGFNQASNLFISDILSIAFHEIFDTFGSNTTIFI